MEPKTEAQHVVPYEGKWGVRAENSEMPSKLFDSKVLATAHAFDIADNNEGKIVIHDSEGNFKEVTKTDNASKIMTALSS